MKPEIKFTLILILIAVIIIDILAFAPALRHPFTLDETEEAAMGQRVSEIGAKTFLDVPEGGMDVTHPLLYTYSHALVQRVFGSTEIPLRLYGIFHYLLSLLLLILITRMLVDNNEGLKNLISFSAAILYLSNPLLLQHSIVVNSDNSILTTALLAFVYFFIRFQRQQKQDIDYLISRLLLGLLFAICLWAKESTPIAMAMGVMVYSMFSRPKSKFLIDFSCVLVFGLIVFWVSWWLYCALTGVDVLGFIKFTIIGKSKEAFSGRFLGGLMRNGLRTLVWPTYWVSAPLLLLSGLLVARRAYNFFKTKELELVDFILCVALSIWLPFQFIKPNPDMMKYQYPAYPLLIAAIAYCFAQAVSKLDNKNEPFLRGYLLSLVIALPLFIAGFYYYKLGDYLLILWEPITRHMGSRFLIYYYLPIVLALAALFLIFKRRATVSRVILVLAFFIVPINAGLLLNQARADYATVEIYRNYGEVGLRQTIEYLAQYVKPDSVVALRNDLAYHLLHRKNIKLKRSFDPKRMLAIKDGRSVALFLVNAPIEYIVFDKVSSLNNPSSHVVAVINTYFTLDKRIGDFYIFKRRKAAGRNG